MRVYAAGLATKLAIAQDTGIEPAMFVSLTVKNRTTNATAEFGFWTGDENITLDVESTEGGLISRTFIGGVNLTVDNIVYVADLTDNPVSVGLSQIADEVQNMVRGYTARFAQCLIHGTSWSGGQLVSVPQLLYVGIVDEAPISTPEVDSDGSILLSVRSELMAQLMRSNSARSSDSHQRRRQANDSFSQFSGIVDSWKVQWYKKG